MVGGDKSFVGIIVTHRRLVKDEAEDASVAERSILSDDKGATFIVQHFMNPSIVYGKPQKRGGMIHDDFSKTHYLLFFWSYISTEYLNTTFCYRNTLKH